MESKIDDKLNSLNTTFNTKIHSLETKLHDQINSVDTKLDAKFHTLNYKIDTMENRLDNNMAKRHGRSVLRNRLVAQMRAILAASREPAGKL